MLVLLLVLAGITPLFWVGRYYFRGDTQIAYLPWWYHLGERVRQGDLPLMEPLAWEAGNYVAEGQWGLFSPLTILIGVLATIVPDVVVFVTVVKIGLIVLGGTGTYLVARSYAAREPFAVVAGLVVGLSSWSVFIDWPSWVNGQMGVALLPWAWWFTRRAMAGRNPVGALVLCYLVVSVGYVYCAIYVAVILLGCLVDAMLSRSRRELLTVLALGIFSGLVTVAVYLPGVLTAPVTGRNTWAIVWRGPLTMSLAGLLRLDAADAETPLRRLAASCRPVDGSRTAPSIVPRPGRCVRVDRRPRPVGPRSERHRSVAVAGARAAGSHGAPGRPARRGGLTVSHDAGRPRIASSCRWPGCAAPRSSSWLGTRGCWSRRLPARRWWSWRSG